MSTLPGLAILFIVGAIFVGCVVLVPIAYGLRKLKASVSVQRSLFVLLGTIILSPVLAPAGTIAAIPLPLGFLLIFTHSAADISYLAHMWWFVAPSMFVTAVVCIYISWRIFPNYSFQRTLNR